MVVDEAWMRDERMVVEARRRRRRRRARVRVHMPKQTWWRWLTHDAALVPHIPVPGAGRHGRVLEETLDLGRDVRADAVPVEQPEPDPAGRSGIQRGVDGGPAVSPEAPQLGWRVRPLVRSIRCEQRPCGALSMGGARQSQKCPSQLGHASRCVWPKAAGKGGKGPTPPRERSAVRPGDSKLKLTIHRENVDAAGGVSDEVELGAEGLNHPGYSRQRVVGHWPGLHDCKARQGECRSQQHRHGQGSSRHSFNTHPTFNRLSRQYRCGERARGG